MVGAEPGTIVVAVLTYRRPADLAAILPALADQIRALRAAGDDARILVIDNDPAESGRDVVARSGVAVEYRPEPRPGIAAARNRAFDAAGAARLLVFIDDDERPQAGWLCALVATWRRTGAALVAGPVTSEFEVEPEPWVRDGGFFERRRPADLAPLTVAATNNLLVDLDVVRELGLRFDDRFGASGGEDTLFTRALTAAGRPARWSAGAGVVDVVPAARVTRSWVLRRAFSSGNSWALTSPLVAVTTGAAIAARVRDGGRGGIRLAGGLGRAALGALGGGRRHRARGLRTAARGAGMLAGAVGVRYREYARRPSAAS